MKDLYLLAFIFALLCIPTSCTTLNNPNLTPQQKAEKVLQEDGDLIKAGVQIATRAIIQYCDENPSKRQEIKAEVNKIAGLICNASGGTIDPNYVTATLKVKEKYINDILSAVAPLYKAGYNRLQEIGEAGLAIKYLQLISSGIKEATN